MHRPQVEIASSPGADRRRAVGLQHGAHEEAERQQQAKLGARPQPPTPRSSPLAQFRRRSRGRGVRLKSALDQMADANPVSETRHMIRRLNLTLWAAAALMSVAIAVFSYRYLPRLGPMSPAVLSNLFARPWLEVHVAGAATALMIVPLQLLGAVRRRLARRPHRWLGRTYVVGAAQWSRRRRRLPPRLRGSTAGPIATARSRSASRVALGVRQCAGLA